MFAFAFLCGCGCACRRVAGLRSGIAGKSGGVFLLDRGVFHHRLAAARAGKPVLSRKRIAGRRLAPWTPVSAVSPAAYRAWQGSAAPEIGFFTPPIMSARRADRSDTRAQIDAVAHARSVDARKRFSTKSSGWRSCRDRRVRCQCGASRRRWRERRCRGTRVLALRYKRFMSASRLMLRRIAPSPRSASERKEARRALYGQRVG